MSKLSKKTWSIITRSLVALMAMTLPMETALAIAPTHSQESSSFRTAQASDGKIKVEYEPAQEDVYPAVSRALQRSQVFEEWAKYLSQLFILPRDITLSFQECGTGSTHYDAAKSQITMCYELLEEFRQDFESLGMPAANGTSAPIRAVSAGVFVFLHELGHALIHDLDLPVLGRSEDGADQFATVVLSLDGKDHSIITWSAATQLAINQRQVGQTAASDEHSSPLQRFYNIACISYGSNPSDYPELPEVVLPTSRRSQCVGESQQITRSWARLMLPHVRR
jgi:Putative metallopeptidase